MGYFWVWMIAPCSRQIATKLPHSWSFPSTTFRSFDWALFRWIPPMFWQTFCISIPHSSGHQVTPQCFWQCPRYGCTILTWFLNYPTPFFRFGWSLATRIFASATCPALNFTVDFAVFGRDDLPFLCTCQYFFAIRCLRNSDLCSFFIFFIEIIMESTELVCNMHDDWI